MSTRSSAVIVLTFLVFMIGMASLYQVNEGERAILLRFGKVVKNAQDEVMVITPGLHIKWPIVNTVRLFNTRLQTLAIQSSRIVTEEKKDVLVDSYVKWRINDLSRYYTRTGGRAYLARTLLEQKLNDGLRAEFGKRNISEVVSGERSDIMSLLQKAANESAQSLGIEVIDVRIKRIDLPEEVSHAVFERMRAERKRIANEHRAQGRAQANAMRAKTDADVTVLLAKAHQQAKHIRAKGDSEAALIYAKSYSKDAEFYAFYRSLLAYENAFQKKDFIVLGADSQFFNYFKKAARQGK